MLVRRLIEDANFTRSWRHIELSHGYGRRLDFITQELPQSEFFGEAVREKLIYYPTVTREPFVNQGRINDLMASGKLFADIGLPPMNPDDDRAMLCGSPAMLTSICAVLDGGRFEVSPKIGHAGDYVIERAFVEK